MEQRWQDIQSIWQSNQFLYVVAGFLGGILFFPAIEALSADASQFLSGFVPEAVGIAFTVLLIDRLYQQREGRFQGDRWKIELVVEACGPSNEFAKRAIHFLQYSGHLYGENSLLSGHNMHRANLENTFFKVANLSNTMFYYANLRGAEFWDVNLEGTVFEGADTRNALFADFKFSKETVLPDGSYWTPETDMARFTDPNHPDFWEPDWVKAQRENR